MDMRDRRRISQHQKELIQETSELIPPRCCRFPACSCGMLVKMSRDIRRIDL